MNGQTAQPALPAPRDTSLLRAHARWIVTVALVAVAGAFLVTWVFQKPEYRSQVKVLVGPRLPTGGSPLAPDMETEVQVATSGIVISSAANEVGAGPSYLRRRLSVTVPADSTVLVFRYADRGPAEARRRAAALADAYITYRVGQSSLLSPATTPRSPAGPDYPVNLLAGLAIGLLLGAATAFGRDRLDDRLRGPLDFHEALALPVLATVPVQAGEARARNDEPVLVATPESAAAEPYRYVRLKILKAAGSRRTAMDQSGGPVVVSVTSAIGDDGALPAAANLAAALAGARARVLLVAGDERSQQLSQVLGVDDGPGLTEVMSGNVSLGQAVRPTRVDGLTLLPCGASRSGPGGLVDAMAWRALLEQLDDVSFVVVLSPPVLAAAESLTWADLADLVVLVATVGESTRRELRAAVSELRGTRGQLVGGVVYEGPVPRTAGPVAGVGAEPPVDGSDIGPGASAGSSARDDDGGPADSRTPSAPSAAARSGADA